MTAVRWIPTLAVVAALTTAVVLPATASAQSDDPSVPSAVPTVLSVEQYDTPIDGWNGWLIWSRRTGPDQYSLVARKPSGEGISLPIAPQAAPIDAGIGPGPDGQPLIVYTQCTSPGPNPTGCDVHRIDPLTGDGGRVTAASRADREERFPAVWGTKIAFSLSTGKSALRAGIAVADLDGSAPRRPTIFGPRTQRQAGKTTTVRTYGPRGIDLRGGRLAFSWQAIGRRDQWSLQSTTKSGRNVRQLLSARTTGTVISQIGRPAVGARDIVVPLLRTGGSSTSEIIRSTFSGSRQWALQGGFSAAQTERYGSAMTAVARTDERDLVIVRRLASDGRWACVSSATPTGGCELLRYADPTAAWARIGGSRR